MASRNADGSIAVRDREKRGPASPKGGTRSRGRTKADQRVAEGKPTGAQVVLEKAEMFKDVYRDWRRGFSTAALAERYELTPRRVQQIVDECRAANVEAMRLTEPFAGLRFVDEMIEQAREAVGQAAELTERASEDKNWAAAIGGLKRTASARQELLELMQVRGLVPRNLGLLAAEADGVALVSRILAVFEKYDVPSASAERPHRLPAKAAFPARELAASARATAGVVSPDT